MDVAFVTLSLPMFIGALVVLVGGFSVLISWLLKLNGRLTSMQTHIEQHPQLEERVKDLEENSAKQDIKLTEISVDLKWIKTYLQDKLGA